MCRPRAPDCLLCPVRGHCAASARGLAGELPVRVPKKARPVRRGTVYVGRRADGAVLCERRAPEGLYGGMAGLPGGAWGDAAVPAPPCDADWRPAGPVRHGLTHFALELDVFAAAVAEAPTGLFFLAPDELSALPTVFRACLEA